MASSDRRASPRELLRLPVEWEDGRLGWTRNVSPDGLYVVLPGAGISNRWYSLQIGYAQDRLRFRALAEVMRVEPASDMTGMTAVAMRLHARRFYSAQ